MRDKIIEYLNDYLKINSFHDSSLNGIQVEGKQDIKKVLFAVSYSYSVGKYAAENFFDMIIVHHGIFWGRLEPISQNLKKRIEILIKNDITLAAYHIPLDAHPIIGNNVSMLKLFNCRKVKSFANYHGSNIGVIGYLKKPQKFEKIIKIVKQKINKNPFILPAGKKMITSVAIISGDGSSFINEVVKNKIDLYLTGEVQEHIYEVAQESSINLIAAGHNKTEIFGIKNLSKLIAKKFKIKTSFLNTENYSSQL